MALLMIGAALIVFVWVGQRAQPHFRRGEIRIVSGMVGLFALAGAAFSLAREAWIPALVLGLLGAAGVFSARGPRQANQVDGDRTPMSEEEARTILGVPADASAELVQHAYRRLIRLAHPDQGGTVGLAAQLNAARARLLGR